MGLRSRGPWDSWGQRRRRVPEQPGLFWRWPCRRACCAPSPAAFRARRITGSDRSGSAMSSRCSSRCQRALRDPAPTMPFLGRRLVSTRQFAHHSVALLSGFFGMERAGRACQTFCAAASTARTAASMARGSVLAPTSQQSRSTPCASATARHPAHCCSRACSLGATPEGCPGLWSRPSSTTKSPRLIGATSAAPLRSGGMTRRWTAATHRGSSVSSATSKRSLWGSSSSIEVAAAAAAESMRLMTTRVPAEVGMPVG
mmetsp:Transcript_93840/g.297814  ORF Transcript_93840/g.297814 Transcript_93840/m.297814 type:complete len:258 (-) Transcript_93840:62-835(-)